MAFTTLITPEQLLPHLADPNWAIFDCRFKLEDSEAGRKAYLDSHIAGAVYAHLDQDLSGPKTGINGRHPLPDPDSLIKIFSAWGISESTQVAAYDDVGGGLAAARLWWLLKYMGHDRVAVLDGGWQAWVAANYPTRPGAESRPPTVFVAHPRPDMIRNADEVGELARSSSWAVFDSRAPARYRGDEEPIDPVAGHIPGARNRPWGANLDSSGRVLPPDQLRAQFDKLLGDAQPEQTVFYCGSGVTAAHNVLAIEAAGLPGAKLYPGSWSEWCSDPTRPVATGQE
ncbi:MAG: sulfurtransferase [Chloroflexi bacterium]|nr:sulfurtransferase [Chloroflexota bacterium]